MSVLEQSRKIQTAMQDLIDSQKELEDAGNNKALKASDYDRIIAITIMRLRAGKSYEINGDVIQDPPVSIIEKVARGICWEASLEKDKAEANYKAVMSDINTCRALLNATQSINRYLD